MVLRIEQYLDNKKGIIDQWLPRYFQKVNVPEKLKNAMVYSLHAGGKRLRPILLLSVIEAFGQDSSIGLDVACALEMIHTYSLIHDDLPAMDNDDLRRGLPTNHKIYGEAMAILAGDGLLTYSFELVAGIPSTKVNDGKKVRLIQSFANAAGAEGMVGGQADDLDAEGQKISIETLESIHKRKTGRLLTYAIEAGAILADASADQEQALTRFGQHVGLAFQIQDDILDIEGDEVIVGKPIGSDMANNKNTYPKLLTLNGAKKKLHYHVDEAKKELKKAHVDMTYLEAITDYMIQRNH